MSKKNLLNESQVRQFMKLAQLEPLASGFVEGLNEADEAEELEELRTGRTGALGPPDGTANAGHGRGQGETASGALFEEDEEAQEHDLEDAEHDMDHAEDLEDDAAEDLGDLGDVGAEAGRTIEVGVFLDALEVALEKALGDEVEIDADEMAPEEDEVEMDVELDAADDVEDVDVDVEDEMLEEGSDEELEEVVQKGSDAEEDESLTQDGPERDKDMSFKGRRKVARADARKKKNESTEANDDLVEHLTKRVAARILKSALAKK